MAINADLPKGFVLDQQESTSSGLPDGFVLDKKTPMFKSKEEGRHAAKIAERKVRLDEVGAEGPMPYINAMGETALRTLQFPGSIPAGISKDLQAGNPKNIPNTIGKVITGQETPSYGDVLRGAGAPDNIATNLAGGAMDIALYPGGAKGAVELGKGAVGLAKAGGKFIANQTSKLAPVIEKSAQASYTKALGPTVKAERGIAEKVSPELAKRKTFVWTRGGLQRAAEKNELQAATKLEDAYNALPSDSKFVAKPVLESIVNKQKALEIDGVIPKESEAQYDALNKMKENILHVTENKIVSPQTIRVYRQVLDETIVDSKKGFVMTGQGGPMLKAQRALANSIRREMANQFPSIANVNNEYSFWRNMTDLLETTVHKGKNPLNQVGGVILDVAGQKEVGFVFKNLGALFTDNVAWNTFSGSMKSRLAGLLAKGKMAEADSIISKAFNPEIVGGQGITYQKPLNRTDRMLPSPKNTGQSSGPTIPIRKTAQQYKQDVEGFKQGDYRQGVRKEWVDKFVPDQPSGNKFDVNDAENRSMAQKMFGNQEGRASAGALATAGAGTALAVGVSKANASEKIDIKKINMIESSGNEKAIGDNGKAFGINQIHLGTLNDFNKANKKNYTQKDLMNKDINNTVADWYFNVEAPRLLKTLKMEDNVKNRIRIYNQGYGNIKNGKPLSKITMDYIRKYREK